MLSSLMNQIQEQGTGVLSASFVVMDVCLPVYFLVDLGFFSSWIVVIPYSAHEFYHAQLINLVSTYAYNPQ